MDANQARLGSAHVYFDGRQAQRELLKPASTVRDQPERETLRLRTSEMATSSVILLTRLIGD